MISAAQTQRICITRSLQTASGILRKMREERGVAIMCREMEIMRNQAHEEGVEIGIKKGRMLQLIKQVCAKMQKFSSAEEIANDLVEQDVPLIQKIMDVAPNFGPDYNVDAIYKALNL